MSSLDKGQFGGSHRKIVLKYLRDLGVEERAAWTVWPSEEQPHSAPVQGRLPLIRVLPSLRPHSATSQLPDALPRPRKPLHIRSPHLPRLGLLDARVRAWVWSQEASSSRPVPAPSIPCWCHPLPASDFLVGQPGMLVSALKGRNEHTFTHSANAYLASAGTGYHTAARMLQGVK